MVSSQQLTKLYHHEVVSRRAKEMTNATILRVLFEYDDSSSSTNINTAQPYYTSLTWKIIAIFSSLCGFALVVTAAVLLYYFYYCNIKDLSLYDFLCSLPYGKIDSTKAPGNIAVLTESDGDIGEQNNYVIDMTFHQTKSSDEEDYQFINLTTLEKSSALNNSDEQYFVEINSPANALYSEHSMVLGTYDEQQLNQTYRRRILAIQHFDDAEELRQILMKSYVLDMLRLEGIVSLTHISKWSQRFDELDCHQD